jgi:hypothetical protein
LVSWLVGWLGGWLVVVELQMNNIFGILLMRITFISNKLFTLIGGM